MTQLVVRKEKSELSIFQNGIPCSHHDLCFRCNGVSLEDEGLIYLSDEIDDMISDSFRADLTKMVLDRYKNVRETLSRDITVMLETPGGWVGSGLAVYNTVRRLQKQYSIDVNMLVEGNTASMGTVVLQAGANRIMADTATLHIHDVKKFSFGESQADELLNEGENLRAHLKIICGIYAARNTKGYTDPEWWQAEIKKNREWNVGAGEALKYGLVDELV